VSAKRIAADATAFPHRSAPFNLIVLSACAASGLNDARLAALQQTDDPTNRFRANQHSAPAGSARRVGPARSS
jgi:hypothetical protein